jgi:hypothetical protein
LLRWAAAAEGGSAIEADSGCPPPAPVGRSPKASVDEAVVAGALARCEPDIVKDRGRAPSEPGRGTEEADETDGGRPVRYDAAGTGIATGRAEVSPPVAVVGLLLVEGSVCERKWSGGGVGEDERGAAVRDDGCGCRFEADVDGEGAGSSLVGRTTVRPGVCIGPGAVIRSGLCIGVNADRFAGGEPSGCVAESAEADMRRGATVREK